MTGHGVHVPHEQHGGHSSEGGLGRWIAIFTALVATLGAVIGHEAEEFANKALLLKNEAVLKKTEAANQWAYYQAVSTKSHLMELAMTLTPAEKQAPFAEKITKYTKQKDEIQTRANALETATTKANDASAALLEPRLHLMSALALLQIAISVASVTALTRQRWLFGIAILGSVAGLVTAGLAFLAH